MRLARAALAFLAVSVWLASARADDWPQWLGPQRDGVWREKGILDKLPRDGPKRLWREKIGGGYAGPAVAGGKVFVHDRVLDEGQKDPENPFFRANSKGKERILCLDATTGKQLWLKEYACTYKGVSYPAGPRATPTIDGDRVYTLGAMGDLQCRKVKDGELVWEKNLMKEYKVQVAVWGFSAHLLIDGDNLITLVGKKPVVVALDKNNGKEQWQALKMDSSEVGYCPPMIYEFDKKRHLVIWHPEAVCGLDPTTGKTLWTHDWPVQSNLTIPTPRQVGNKLFLTSFYNGCRLLEIGESPRVVWKSEASKGRPLSEQPKNTDKLHSIMVTPAIKGGHVYGVDSYGELRCLDLKDGKRVWSETTATGAGKEPVRWATAFLVEQGDRFFLFNEKGELIVAKLSPKGYEEVSRAKLLDPTYQLGGGGKFGPGRKVLWSHPAYANKCVFARNDKEVVCYSLAAE
jgi:outer membrane protein assembly factor BamB